MPSPDFLKQLAEKLVDQIAKKTDFSTRCKALASKLFSPETAANQIVAALQQ